MNILFFIIPVVLALVIIGVFILNQTEVVSIDRMDTRLARVLVIISFLMVFLFVVWFVFTLMPLPER